MRAWTLTLVIVAVAPSARADERAETVTACEPLGAAIVRAFGAADFADARGTAEQLGKLLCEVGPWPKDVQRCFRDAANPAASSACVEKLAVPQRLELEAGMAGVNPLGVVLTRTQLELKGPILFDGTDRIHIASDALLAAVARTLIANPTVRIEIRAHVDASEPPERALKRSQRRAEAVRAFLVKRQVAASRLAVKGVGSAQPIGDNATELGRARNRRIELAIAGPGERSTP